MAQEQEVIQQFKQLYEQQSTIANKIAELETDKREHESVLEALKEIPDDRKCFRLVGGVLVERTKQQVVPAVEENVRNIEETIAKLTEALNEKSEEVNAFKQQYKIRFTDEPAPSQKEAKEEKTSAGVLA